MGSVPHLDHHHTSDDFTFNVAIIGGGIGGLALALALNKYPHINYQIYEAAPKFSEIGAGVSVGPNARRALELIGPDAFRALTDHLTSNLWPSHQNTWVQYTIGKGPNADDTITHQRNAYGQQSIHRAKFLDGLVQGVPPQRAHFNKRLVRLEDPAPHDKPVKLFFKDGTTETADCVIGADGIHSPSRAYIMGSLEAANPVFSGTVVYRSLVPMDEAVEKLGDEYANNCYISCGPHRAIMSYPIEFGELLNVVVMDYKHENWEHEKWIVPADWNNLSELFEGWGPQSRGIIELLNKPDLSLWALHDMPPTPTYFDHNVAMLGDAAHATTPFQGQGAGQAIEDALVLSKVLAKIEDKSQIPNAFSAYDQVRRPRSQKIVSTSRDAGELCGMTMVGVGGDVAKMKKEFDVRMRWIWGRDQSKQCAEAVELLEESMAEC
ncbi:uncharacterized protein KY384_008545 [Bacidia gigantensis]|uniref:uncharacterized protein n=1 Tax=Bacidia gigantensis TaxID=2732470 RepID=UPI001D03FF89|nr:uncharacterized protein KY384_008545 [Bacidia gigantensis]KAG8527116.1 hypothetical protein KY384_008545 [Bacidia gigantensis]